MTKVNQTRDIQAITFGMDMNVSGQIVYDASTLTSPTATAATLGTRSATVNDLAGQVIITTNTSTTWAAANVVYGNILSNTSGANTVVTVDRWYNPSSPGGAAGTTPITGAQYVILPSAAPFWYMGLSTLNSGGVPTAVSATDTGAAMGGVEFTTTGLKRKICPLAHTAGASTATLIPVFTASSDTYPAVVDRIAVVNSIVASKNWAYFITVLSSEATLNADGDTLTITETITVG